MRGGQPVRIRAIPANHEVELAQTANWRPVTACRKGQELLAICITEIVMEYVPKPTID